MPKTISSEDMTRRDRILGGNLMKALMMVAAPLVLQQCLVHVFQMIDTSVSAGISSQAVSAVYYISQIITVIGSVAQGISVGAGIRIATEYGAGKYDEVHEYIRSMFMLAILCSGGILLVCIPFADQIMRLARTPEEFFELGRMYFIISLFGAAVDMFNSCYLAMERARGNTKKILYLQVTRAVVKLAFTVLFVKLLSGGMPLMAVATLIANLFMTVFGVRNLRRGGGVFSFSLKEFKLKGNMFRSITNLAVPSGLEKCFFHLGKLVVNSMMVFYGSTTVGVFSVAQTMSILINGVQVGMQDSASTVINQNRGNGNYSRALGTFRLTMLINVGIGVLGGIGVVVFREAIFKLFSSGEVEFMNNVFMLNGYIAVTLSLMGISYAVVALLYGFGKTRMAMSINFCRLFVLRIPMLWFFENYTSMGMEAVGWAMVLSNAVTAVISLIMAWAVIAKVKKEQGVGLFDHS